MVCVRNEDTGRYLFLSHPFLNQTEWEIRRRGCRETRLSSDKTIISVYIKFRTDQIIKHFKNLKRYETVGGSWKRKDSKWQNYIYLRIHLWKSDLRFSPDYPNDKNLFLFQRKTRETRKVEGVQEISKKRTRPESSLSKD